MKVIPPPLYLVVFLVAAALMERFKPLPIPWISYEFRTGLWIAAVLVALTFAFALWAIAVMTKHKTTVEPGHTPSALVTSGPFRFTRNPLYLSLVVFATSAAIAMASSWFLLAALLLFLALDLIVIRREERMIGLAFGDAYGQYCASVRRWI